MKILVLGVKVRSTHSLVKALTSFTQFLRVVSGPSMSTYKALILINTLMWTACIEPPPESSALPDMDIGNDVSTESDMPVSPDMNGDLPPDLCENGRQDNGEDGVDCGGVCYADCGPPTNCIVGANYTLKTAYADQTCDVITLPKGTHTLDASITRDVSIEGKASTKRDEIKLDGITITDGTVNIAKVTVCHGGRQGITQDGGHLTVTNVSFKDCLADKGGAIKVVRGTTKVVDSYFENNRASSQGGAIWTAGDLFIQRSNFKGNMAEPDGSVSSAKGGAIYSESGNLTIESSNFKENFAKSGAVAEGGAVYQAEGNATYRQTALIKNFAEGTTVNGGAIAAPSQGDLFFENVTFGQNQLKGTGGKGAAIYAENGTTKIFSVTFNENSHNWSDDPTAATIDIANATVTINNTIFADDMKPSLGQNPNFTNRNIGQTEVPDVISIGLLGLKESEMVPKTWFYGLEATSPARIPTTCKDLNNVDLLEDQARNTRAVMACFAGAYQGP